MPQISSPEEQQKLQQAFDLQVTHMLAHPNDGSPAIALGRSAGLAKQLGYDRLAAQLWNQIGQLPGQANALPAQLPNLDDMHRAYSQNPGSFAEFAKTENYPAPGSDFSNALGSYGFALDYARRGKTAIVGGGEPQYIASWGAQALSSAGYANQAGALAQLVSRRAEQQIS